MAPQATLWRLSLLFCLSPLVAALPSLPSTHDRRDASPSGWTYKACYTDNSKGLRALSSNVLATDDMTLEKCSTFCSGYKYFGVEYSRECYCSSEIQADASVADEGDCTMACSGNAGQTCGAGNRINVYSSNNYAAVGPATLADHPYLGCFVEGNQRVLPSKSFASDEMTAALCAANCAGYKYFGTQWSRECWCGDKAPTAAAPDSDCSNLCTGSKSERCGGDLRLSVYGPAAGSGSTTGDSPSSGTPATVSGFAYQGCYTDNVPQRVLSGPVMFDGAMTLEMCASFCSGSNYATFGVEFGGECYCGVKVDAASTKVAEGDCTMACNGNTGQNCGAGNRLNVYASATATSNGPANMASVDGFYYSSCWLDNVVGRSLSANSFASDDMTVQKCATFCQGYKFFGVEYGRECYCDNAILASKAEEQDCAQVCAGDKTQFCGNGNRLSVYSTTPPSSGSPSDSTGSGSTASGDSSIAPARA